MQAALVLLELIQKLRDAGVEPELLAAVEAHYKLTYREAYAAGKSYCEESHASEEDE